MISAGTAFFIEVPRSSNKHIWVVITEPDTEEHTVVMANFTSVKDGRSPYDPTTIVEPEEFERVLTTVSCVRYSDARIVTVTNLRQMLETDFVERKDDCPQALLNKLQQGILSSPQTPHKIVDYARCQLGSAHPE